MVETTNGVIVIGTSRRTRVLLSAALLIPSAVGGGLLLFSPSAWISPSAWTLALFIVPLLVAALVHLTRTSVSLFPDRVEIRELVTTHSIPKSEMECFFRGRKYHSSSTPNGRYQIGIHTSRRTFQVHVTTEDWTPARIDKSLAICNEWLMPPQDAIYVSPQDEIRVAPQDHVHDPDA